ncbi:MBL fold metallo-hydrolase RNA specificity domain-containing protein [Salegentibacter chungangensis]|uniref:MBL fold metallo-hydrolase RNA specificity domain-containing protein n=1 Tax=Salegentibacter chungangensis TaxID=1335724 RepID=A0ABW3NTF9_9FLAO
MKSVKLHFLGAAGTVTGSKFLLETDEGNILIDCGMFQGIKDLRLLNWQDFNFPPLEIDLVLLTHGHLDHSGYLPRLFKQGYKGPVKSTAPSLAVTSVILMDSAKIMEEDAEKANEEGYSIHEPPLPFYTVTEAEKTIEYFEAVEIDTWYKFSNNIGYRFLRNGHIIGATFIEFEITGKRIVFSGDIGREKDPLLPPPYKPQQADYLILESTYGDRLHPEENIEELLSGIVKDILEKRGILIIPSFAVERLQHIMYILWKLYEKNKIPNIPIFIDSPMGNDILGIFSSYPAWHRIDPGELRKMISHFNIITSYGDTWKTIDDNRPKIVVAGSGMVTGGRVLTYLRYYLEKPETYVILIGFQAEGTRGRQLQEGAAEIKIFGKYCKVNASIKHLQSLSAHADQQELLGWLKEIKNKPEKVFLVHGEPAASDFLRLKIKDTYSWPVHIPHLNETVELLL